MWTWLHVTKDVLLTRRQQSQTQTVQMSSTMPAKDDHTVHTTKTDVACASAGLRQLRHLGHVLRSHEALQAEMQLWFCATKAAHR